MLYLNYKILHIREIIMFKNSGQKTMDFAKILFVIQLVLYSFLGIALISMGIENGAPGQIVVGAIILVIGVIIAWLNGLIIYAFGTLVGKTEENAENTKAMLGKMDTIISKMNAPAAEAPKDWFCTECGTKNEPESAFCKECGTKH
jgi:hypothetical protein